MTGVRAFRSARQELDRRAGGPDDVTLTSRDLLALQAFELAARAGSFKAAAEQLHLTSSAISHRIAGLERQFGARLFERGPRGVVLAPVGRLLAATTGRAFSDLSRALVRQGTGSHRLRVSAVPIFATHFLLPRLGQFLALHPEIELQVEASPRMADMEAGLVDVALRYGDGQWEDVASERVMDLAAVPLASPALAKRLRLRTPADIVRTADPRLALRCLVARLGSGRRPRSQGLRAAPRRTEGHADRWHGGRAPRRFSRPRCRARVRPADRE